MQVGAVVRLWEQCEHASGEGSGTTELELLKVDVVEVELENAELLQVGKGAYELAEFEDVDELI